MRLASAAAVALVFTATSAGAAQVTREATIDAEPAKVWAEIGPFCSISAWHPAIAKCDEATADGGTLRTLTTQDGGMFEERLLSHDDQAMSYSYSILKSPLPVSDYQSTISVSGKDGKSQVVWTSSFEPKGASAEEAEKVVGGIYEAGLEALKGKVK